MSGWRVQGWDAVSIGEGIVGGIANCVLYIDAGGLLACDTAFKYNGSDVLSVGNTALLAWSGTLAAVQIGGNGSIAGTAATGASGYMALSQNGYYDGGNWRYISTDEGTQYIQQNGTHIFSIAQTGVAGNAIAWVPILTIPYFTGAGLSLGKTGWENWNASYTVMQFGGLGYILTAKVEAATTSIHFGHNAYLQSGTWKYTINDEASTYEQFSGKHSFYTAVAGVADAAIVWLKCLELLNNQDSLFYGDTYWSGTGSGLFYGSAQTGTTNINWTQVAAQNTWYEISDADIIDGDLNNITHDGNGKLTVLTAQIYDAIGIITISTSIAGKHVEVTFSINGTPRTTRGIQHMDIVTVNSEIVIPIADTLDLAANDTVEIAVRTTDAGNPTLTIDHYTLKLLGIGGT